MVEPSVVEQTTPPKADLAAEEATFFCPHCHAAYRSRSYVRCPLDGAELQGHVEDPLIDATIGEQYVITRCIAYGATSRVYHARHIRLHRRELAIKVLLGDLTASMTTRMRFAQEGELLSLLDHPNIVSVVDFARTPEGLLYLVMDLANGPTLAHLIHRKGPIAPRRAIALAQQLCRGLGHAHAHGIVHRDFKPDNVIIEQAAGDELARIIDFGIALTREDEDGPRITQAEISLGTPAYASPEQALSQPIDHRSDLFALGVTLYEMLAGMQPFSGEPYELLQFNAFSDPPAINDRNPEAEAVPAELEAVVRRLMARDPAERYQSATEVVRALDEVLGLLGSASLPRARAARPSLRQMELDAEEELAALGSTAAKQPAMIVGSRWPRVLIGVAVLGAGAVVAATQLGSSPPPFSTSGDAQAAVAVMPMPAPVPMPVPAAMPGGGAEMVRPAAAMPAARDAGATVAQAAQATTAAAAVAAVAAVAAEKGRKPQLAAKPAVVQAAGHHEHDVPVVSPSQLAQPTPAGATAADSAVPAASAPAAATVTPAAATASPPAAAPAATATPASPPGGNAASAPPPATNAAIATSKPATPPVMALVGHELQVTGALSPRTVELAVGRVGDSLAACGRLATVKSARVRFVIDEQGRATSITVEGTAGELASCVRAAVAALRTETPPEVGTVDAVLALSFSAKPAP